MQDETQSRYVLVFWGNLDWSLRELELGMRETETERQRKN